MLSSIHNIQSGVLCQMHYNFLYRQIYLSPCACCDAKPRPRNGPFTRHSPDATAISLHLQNTGFNFTLTPADTICKSCYNMHLVILNNAVKRSESPTLQLESDIAMWKKTLADETSNNFKTEQFSCPKQHPCF
jgi:hypothetical protein